MPQTPDVLNYDQLIFDGMIFGISTDKKNELNRLFALLEPKQQEAAIRSYSYFIELGFTLEFASFDDLPIFINDFLVTWGLNDWTMEYLKSDNFTLEDRRLMFIEALGITASSAEALASKQNNAQAILDRIGYIKPSEEPAHFKDAAEVDEARMMKILQPLQMQGIDGVFNNETPTNFLRPGLVEAMRILGGLLADNNLGGYLRISSGVRNLQTQEILYKLGFPAINGLSFHTQGNAVDFPLSRTVHDTKPYNEAFAEEMTKDKLEIVNEKLATGETLTIEKLAEWGVIPQDHPLMEIIYILRMLEPMGIQFLDETYFNSVGATPVEITEGEIKKEVIQLDRGVRPLLHVQFNSNLSQQEL